MHVAHPTWSGQLQISLVSFGVKLFPATSAASQISFHEIDRETGERVRRQSVVENNRPIDRSQIVKGYEYHKGKYLIIDPEEIDALRLPTKRALEISQFVAAAEIDPSFFDRPYFVVPEDDEQTQAYQVIREALQASGKAGLGEVSFDRREHLVAIVPQMGKHARGLMAYTLRYAGELRKPDEYFSSIGAATVDADQLALAKELIRRRTHVFDASDFKDDYETALQKMLDAKLKNEPLAREEEEARPEKVVNLMEALRRSIGEKNGKAPAKRAAASARKGRAIPAKKGPVPVRPAAASHRRSA
nr:Ku protein [Paracidobacterium acidisoli]